VKSGIFTEKERKERQAQSGKRGIIPSFLHSNRRGRRSRQLTSVAQCHTLLCMKTATLSIRLDKDLNRLLGKTSRRSGQTRSEVARQALRRQLRLMQFESVRRRMMPFAEARGFLTDEDVFSKIS